eukprot:6206580-Pleurochrysis_carterae.AAC.2
MAHLRSLGGHDDQIQRRSADVRIVTCSAEKHEKSCIRDRRRDCIAARARSLKSEAYEGQEGLNERKNAEVGEKTRRCVKWRAGGARQRCEEIKNQVGRCGVLILDFRQRLACKVEKGHSQRADLHTLRCLDGVLRLARVKPERSRGRQEEVSQRAGEDGRTSA